MRVAGFSLLHGLVLLLTFIAGVATTAGLGADAAMANESPEHRFTLRQLENRKQQQIAAARRYTAFHGFTFNDGIEASGIRFEHQIVEDAGRNYQAAHYDHGNAVAAADVDGDRRIDLYFTTQIGTNQLWRNTGDGRFEDFTGTAGVGLPGAISVAASFADIDNDGDPDLFVTTVCNGNHLFENTGGGRFRDISAEAGIAYSGHSSGAVFFDYDNDGLLDLLVVNVGVYTARVRGAGGYFLALPDAFQGHLHPQRTEYSRLYRNLGNARFKDVTEELGFKEGGWTGDGTFTDLNNDGYQDLYLVNMQGDDRFYENARGKGFVEKTAAYFPKTPWGSMGAKFFDFDQNGLMDLFVTDMHSDMTQPQTLQALQFRIETEKAKSEAWCSAQWPEEYYQGSTNNIFGNAFYRNHGSGRFEECSETLGVETYWPWGCSVGDLNADSFEDIVVTAGMGFPFRYAINSVLLNDGGKRFMDAEFILGVEPRADRRTEKVWFELDCNGADRGHPMCAGFSGRTNILGTLSTRSSVVFDIDDDGDLDIVTQGFHDRPQVLVSDLTAKRPVRYLKVSLAGRPSNRDGLGAVVQVRIGDRTLTQRHDGKSGYLAQSSMPLYFGLGSAARVDSVEVQWPSGRRQVVKDVSGSSLRIEEQP